MTGKFLHVDGMEPISLHLREPRSVTEAPVSPLQALVGAGQPCACALPWDVVQGSLPRQALVPPDDGVRPGPALPLRGPGERPWFGTQPR